MLLVISDLTSQPASHSHFVHVAFLGLSLGLGRVVVCGHLGHLHLVLWAQQQDFASNLIAQSHLELATATLLRQGCQQFTLIFAIIMHLLPTHYFYQLSGPRCCISISFLKCVIIAIMTSLSLLLASSLHCPFKP